MTRTPSCSPALAQLDIPALWAKGLSGQGVGVGHLDTGVHAQHPALAGRVAGFAFVNLDGDLDSGCEPFDSAWHGTHTAGLICGGTVNGISHWSRAGGHAAQRSRD